MALAFKHLSLFSVMLAGTLPALAPTFAFAESLTIQGRVADSAGVPVNGPATQFRVQILSPDSARCVLFDETHTVDLSNSYGLFSINLNDGLGTRTGPSVFALESALSNRASFTVDASACTPAGTGTRTYSPGPNDNRKVKISFKDPAKMGAFEAIPEMDINPVAFAMESRTVGGYDASSLLKVQDAGVLGSAPAFTTGQFSDLQALIAGTSANYMQSGTGSNGGARLPTYSGNPSSLAAGAIWFDTASGTVRYSPDGTLVKTVGNSASGSGSMITSITAGSGLTGGGSAGAVSLALSPSGVGAAGSVGSGSSVPVLNYDTYGRLTGVSSAAISGLLPTAGGLGSVLKSDGTNWASDLVRSADVRSIADNATIFPATSCTASQTLIWNSVSDKLQCQTISLPAASATVANSYKMVTVAADGRVNGGSNPTTLAGFGITDSLVANTGGVPNLRADTYANIGAASTAGRLFVATDTLTLYRDNGSAWDIIGAAGAGGSLSGVSAGTGLTGGGTSGNVTLNLSNVGTAGAYYKVTTDAQGRVTSGNNALVAADIPNLDWAKIASGKPTSLSGYGITDALVANGGGALSLTAGAAGSRPGFGTVGRIYLATDTGVISYDTGSAWAVIASAAGSGGDITDVTAGTGLSGGGTSGAVSLSLATAGTAGTYPKVTTDAYGRVISGAALAAGDIPSLPWSKITSGTPTDLAGYGITDALRNADGSVPSISSGTEAALPAPAAGNLNFLYIANDTKKIFRQIAGTWTVIGAAPSSGFTGSLAGEVSGTQAATQVDAINGITRATITTNLNTVSSATDVNTNSTLVKRDGTGSFAATNATVSELRLKDSGTNTVKLKAGATSATYSLQFPTVAPAAGESLQANASGVLSWVTAAAGTLSDVLSGNAAITVTGSGSTRSVSLTNTAVTPNSYGSATKVPSFTVDAQGRLTAAADITIAGVAPGGTASGDLAGTYPAPTVAKLQTVGVSATAPSLGQVLKYVSSNWAATTLELNDLKASDGTTSAVNSAVCTAAQSLYYDTGTKSLKCQAIGTLASAAITDLDAAKLTGTIDPARLPAAATPWTISGSDIYRNGGNVFIGTTAGTAKLTVASAANQLQLIDTAGAADTKRWNINATSGYLRLQAIDDAGAGGGNVLDIGRTTNNLSYVKMGSATPTFYADIANGRVGIGTSSPSDALEVRNTTGAARLKIRGDANSSTTRAELVLDRTAKERGAGIRLQGSTDAPAEWWAGIPYDLGGTTDQFTIGRHATQPESLPNAFVTVKSTGNVGIGTTAPTAALHLKAGSAAASSSPLKFTSGPTLTTKEDGAFEYDGTNYYLTIGTTRYAIPLAGGAGSFSTVGAGTGSAAAPSLSFSGDSDTGFYNASSNNTISVAAGGSKIFDFSSAGLASPTTGGANVTSSNGTAAAPTYSFAGDLGTGWFRALASTLAASTGGTERMRIDAGGNVGIGTTNPLTKFQLGGDSDFLVDGGTPFTLLRSTTYPSSGSQVAGMGFISEGSASSSTVWPPQGSISFFATENHSASSKGSSIQFATTPNGSSTISNRMTIDQSGNVGIGSSTPGQKLSVAGSIVVDSGAANNGTLTSSLIFGGDASGEMIASKRTASGNQYGLDFYTSSTNRMAISAAGNVGIGTSAPAQSLHVVTTGADHTPVQIGTGVGSLFLTHNNATISSNLRYDDSAWRYEAAGVGSLIDLAAGGINFRTAPSGTAAASVVPTDLMNILASGNVGIGAASPVGKLHVRTATDQNLLVRGPVSGSNGISLYSTNDANDTVKSLQVEGAPLILNAGASYVGIGVAAPTDKLQVNGNLRLGTTVGGGSIPGYGNSIIFSGGPAAGDNSDPMTISRYDIGSDQTEMRVLIGDNGSYGVANDAFVVGTNTGTWNPYFRVESGGMVGIGAPTNQYQRLTVSGAAGQHGIVGITADTGNAYYGVAGYAGSYSGSLGRADGYAFVGSGNVWATGNGMFNQSDARYKENVNPLDSSLAMILKLRPVSYTWKKNSEAHKSTGDKPQFGLIAQEVQKVIPDIVIMNHAPPTSPNKDGSLTIDAKLGESLGVEYTKIIPFLIGAVQELKHQVDGIFSSTKADHEELMKVKAENAELKSYLCAKDPSAPFCGRKTASTPANK